jgi:transcriptional regulator
MLSVAGDWAFIPSSWKAIDGEDPTLGIPTTYYGAVQLSGSTEVSTDPAGVAAILRRQLRELQPEIPVADPEIAHAPELRSIWGVTLAIEEVRAKFKYGGNVDRAHRQAVVDRLRRRRGPGDVAAADHVERRSR